MGIPRFRGHPDWREYAPGGTHGKTEAKEVHGRIQGGRGEALVSLRGAWGMAGRVLGDEPWTELLDFFHGASRLGNAAKAIWGTSEEATVTGEHWKTVLCEKTRGAALVLKSLEYQRSVADAATAKELTQSINYLVRHKREGRLGYAAATRLHLPIGTGVTEAAARTLVSVRMKRSGARYSDHGGSTILTLRAAILSDRFDTLSAEIESSYVLPVAA